MGLFSKQANVMSLARREAVLHLHDGETSLRGFLLDFYRDDSGEVACLRIGKPSLMTTEAVTPETLGGEVLIFKDQIKFMQLL